MKETDAGVWSSKFKALLLACGVVIIALLVLIAVLLMRSPASGSKETDEAKSNAIVEKVGDIYLLPEEEEPTVAEIQDKTKMTDNKEFFLKAENGDYLLIYKEAKLALIYRDAENKLINVAPVNFDADDGQPGGDTGE
jgi:hypothetical protein